MWEDIRESFKKELSKPFDWTPFIVIISLYSLSYLIFYIYSNYYELLKFIFIYSCSGLGVIAFLVLVGAWIYSIFMWARKIYVQSKEECQ
jgi:hypothetical protein